MASVQETDAENGRRDLRQELVQEGTVRATSSTSLGSAAQDNHMAVRESLQIALEASMHRCGRCWLLMILLVLLSAGCITAWSETVYEHHYQDECNQPLAPLLRALYVVSLLNIFQRDIVRCFCCYNAGRDGPDEPVRVKLFRRSCLTALIVWPVVGVWMLALTTDCSEELEGAVRAVVISYAVAISVIFVLPACLITIMLALVRRGLVHAPRSEDAAPEGLIDSFPEVAYDPAVFDDNAVGAHPSTCPICLDPFDATKKISQTPCNQGRGHAFHKECLTGWLQVQRSCPLCRVDLVEATPST